MRWMRSLRTDIASPPNEALTNDTERSVAFSAARQVSPQVTDEVVKKTFDFV